MKNQDYSFLNQTGIQSHKKCPELFLLSTVKEGIDYCLLPRPLFKQLVKYFGSEPNEPVMRKSKGIKSGKFVVDVNLILITLFTMNAHVVELAMSLKDTNQHLVDSCRKEFNIEPGTPLRLLLSNPLENQMVELDLEDNLSKSIELIGLNHRDVFFVFTILKNSLFQKILVDIYLDNEWTYDQ